MKSANFNQAVLGAEEAHCIPTVAATLLVVVVVAKSFRKELQNLIRFV